jgi:hypothetical protein
MRFVMDKVALGQVVSEFFGFPCQISFHQMLHIHHHLSSVAGTIGQSMSDVPSGLSFTPPQEAKRTPWSRKEKTEVKTRALYAWEMDGDDYLVDAKPALRSPVCSEQQIYVVRCPGLVVLVKVLAYWATVALSSNIVRTYILRRLK